VAIVPDTRVKLKVLAALFQKDWNKWVLIVVLSKKTWVEVNIESCGSGIDVLGLDFGFRFA
jgi:hypothetical protein